MHRLSSQTPEDFRRILKEKAFMHSLFYLRLEKGQTQPEQTDLKPAVNKPASPPPTRQSLARRGNSEKVSALVKHYTALAGRARADSVASSDEGISDEEPRGQTLVEGRVVAVRRSSDATEMGVVRCVRTPSVVVTDYSEVGATQSEAEWLREAGARLSPALSSCSSCSTLGSRDDDEADSGLGCSRSKKIVFKDDQ